MFTCPNCFGQIPDEVADSLLKLDDKVTAHEQHSALCPACGKLFRRIIRGTVKVGDTTLDCNGDVPCNPYDEAQMIKSKEWVAGKGSAVK